jgi:hypothetical protein
VALVTIPGKYFVSTETGYRMVDLGEGEDLLQHPELDSPVKKFMRLKE